MIQLIHRACTSGSILLQGCLRGAGRFCRACAPARVGAARRRYCRAQPCHRSPAATETMIASSRDAETHPSAGGQLGGPTSCVHSLPALTCSVVSAAIKVNMVAERPIEAF